MFGAAPAASPFGVPTTAATSPFGARPAGPAAPAAAAPMMAPAGVRGQQSPLQAVEDLWLRVSPAMPGAAAPAAPAPGAFGAPAAPAAPAGPPPNVRCEFKHAFYSRLQHAAGTQFVRPPEFDERLWAVAMRDNPDAARLVPQQVVGLASLKARATSQKSFTETQLARLKDLDVFLRELGEKHKQLEGRLPALRLEYAKNVRRLLAVVGRLDRVCLRGRPLGADEEALNQRLEQMYAAVTGPARLRGRLEELETAVRTIEEQPKQSFEIRDPAQIVPLQNFIKHQQEALEKLVEALKRDQAEVAALQVSLSPDGSVRR
eukprot:m51a1_g559 hypothetical protein (318) ;mRNA; f:485215-486536